MKKSRFFISLAASLLVVAACQKNELVSSQGEEVVVDFFAQSIETKTVFGEPDGTTYPTLWTSNDTQVKVVVNSGNNAKAADLHVSEDGKTANFSASIPSGVSAPYIFKVVSPAEALIGYSTTKGVNIAIPDSQEPLTTSVDERAQILYATSTSYETWPSEPVQLKFSHLTAYGKISITNLNETEITSITLKSDMNWAGRWNYNGSEFIENSATDLITIKTDHLSDVWFACAPVNMAGKNLEISVETANGVYNKSINFTRGGNFESGKIAKFSVSFEGVTPTTEQVVYTLVKSVDELTVGSEVIIAAAGYDEAISTTQNNNNRAQAEITKSDDGQQIINPSPAVQIFTLAAGSDENTFAFSTGSGYIYAASSSSNHLKTQDNVNGNASFAITFSATGEASIVAIGSNTRNVLSYNATSTPPIFSCYAATNTSNKPVALYIKDSGDTPTTPSIEVQSTLDLTAEEQDGEIAVTFKNFPDLELAAVKVYNDQSCTDECDWLIAYLNDGRTLIEYTVEANTTGSARTAYVKVECLDESSEIVEKVVTVTQQFAVAVTDVTLDKTTASVNVGASITLIATVNPSNAANKNVTWSSNNTSVATVSNGVVTGLKAGEATITVTTEDGGHTATCVVTVTASPTMVYPPYTFDFSTVMDNTWSSSYSEHVVSASGIGSVTFASANKQPSGAVIEGIPVTKGNDITLVMDSGKGIKSVAFTCVQWGSYAHTISLFTSKDGGTTWDDKAFSTSDTFELNATVGETGINAIKFSFSGTKQIGVAKLIINGGADSGSDTPGTVAVTGVTLNPTTASISVGGTVTLTATVNPSNATNKNVTWTSNNTAVATVSNGVVTGKSVGTATITVTTDDGKKTATCTVTVTGGKTYTKVTNATQLVDGTKFIIACDSKNTYAGPWNDSGYFSSTNSRDSAAEFIMKGSVINGNTNVRFMYGEKYVGTSAAKSLSITSGTQMWTFSISNGNATITSINSGCGSIKYNASSPRFVNYTTGQTDIQLYIVNN